MFKEIEHAVVYTDAAFKEFGNTLGYLLAQVPYHPSGRFLLSFLNAASKFAKAIRESLKSMNIWMTTGSEIIFATTAT